MESGVTDRPQEPAPAVVARVEWLFEPEDYVEGYLVVWEKKTLRRQVLKGILLLPCYAAVFAFLVLLAIYWAQAFRSNPLWWIAISPLLLFLFITLSLLVVQIVMLIVPVQKHFQRRRFRKLIDAQRRSGVLRDNRQDYVTLTATGFTEINNAVQGDGGVWIREHKEFDVRWSAVESIDVTDRLAIFTVARKGFLFLPRWAFQNEEAFLRFVETARELWRAFGRERPAAASSPPVGPTGGLQLPS
jgi:hypothetical protein